MEGVLNSIGREYVVAVTGTVRDRVEGTTDPRNPTGEIEVLIEDVMKLRYPLPVVVIPPNRGGGPGAKPPGAAPEGGGAPPPANPAPPPSTP